VGRRQGIGFMLGWFVFNLSMLGFDFFINVFGLDLCFEIPNKQKQKPRSEYFRLHNIQI